MNVILPLMAVTPQPPKLARGFCSRHLTFFDLPKQFIPTFGFLTGIPNVSGRLSLPTIGADQGKWAWPVFEILINGLLTLLSNFSAHKFGWGNCIGRCTGIE
jgi:hypothetical protein